MIEQKLDRIIELLEIIADAQPKRRAGRGTIAEAKKMIIDKRDLLRGKRLTFPEFCEIMGIENTRKNQVVFGAGMNEAGVKSARTKSTRYYIFQ